VWGPSFEQASLTSPLPEAEKMNTRMTGFQKFPRPTEVTPFPVLTAGLNAVQLADSGTTLIRYLEIGKDESQALLERCREHGTTLTGALGSAILQATADTIGELAVETRVAEDASSAYNVSLSCGADTRKLYTPKLASDVLSYHVSGVPTFAIALTPHHSPPEALWKLAQDYRQTITDCLKVEYPLAIAGYIGKIWANSLDAAASVEAKPMTLSLTNWGALALQESYGELRLLNLFPAVNLSHSAFPCVIAQSTAGSLTITVLTHSNIIDPDHAQLLLDNIHKVIRDMLK
jgi:hypothetical protein